MVGSLLRRGPDLAEASADALANPPRFSGLGATGLAGAMADRMVLRHQLYQFGLGCLMGFNEALLRTHFATFFSSRVRSGLASSPTRCSCRA